MSVPKVNIVHKGQATAENGILRDHFVSPNLDYILISTIHVGSKTNNVSYILYNKEQIYYDDLNRNKFANDNYYCFVDDHGSLYKFISFGYITSLLYDNHGYIELQKLTENTWNTIYDITIGQGRQAFFRALLPDLTKLCYTSTEFSDEILNIYSLTDSKLHRFVKSCVTKISPLLNTAVKMPEINENTYSILSIDGESMSTIKVPYPYELDSLWISYSGQTIMEFTKKSIRFLTVEGKVISAVNCNKMDMVLNFSDTYLLTKDKNNNILIWPIHNLSFNVEPLQKIKLDQLYQNPPTIGHMNMRSGSNNIFLLVVDRLDGANHILDWFKIAVE